MASYPHPSEESEETCTTPAWMPDQIRDSSFGPFQTSPKVTKIIAAQPKPYDIIIRFFRKCLVRTYYIHFKQYAVSRRIAWWIWGRGYLFYVSHISTFFRKNIKWRPLTRQSDFVREKGTMSYKLRDAAVVETPIPNVIPSNNKSCLVSPHDRYTFPDIFVAVMNNAVINGGTNLILTDEEVICHDLYDFENDYTAEEKNGWTFIDPKSTRILCLQHDDVPERIPMAASFVDACAFNYAHWMTEILPRICLFCADERFIGIPIVINDGLHHNIMESLFLMAGPEREVITLPIERALVVDELYLTSATGYIPFDRRTNHLAGHSHGVFSPLALEMLYTRLSDMVSGTTENAWPEKIFVRRNSSVRKLTNEAEIENKLASLGYEIIEPERFTFSEQVQLFRNAKIIVGLSGAGLANILFAHQGAKICILISNHPFHSYWYWQNIASASGNTVTYVLGEICGNHFRGVHADFKVDLESLLLGLGEEL